MLSVVACSASARQEPKIIYPAQRREPDDLRLEGEIGAALAAGVDGQSVVAGGDARAGLFVARKTPAPMLISNRFGVDLRLRALYGGSEASALSANLLLGAAPSFTWQIGGLGHRTTEVRVPSLLGLIAPEPGVWFRTDSPTLFYLGWRAPMVWLPFTETGLEVVPCFVWAPRGQWLATVSVGGFVR